MPRSDGNIVVGKPAVSQFRLSPRMQPICWRRPTKVKRPRRHAKEAHYMTRPMR
jgi:hypothetical protein